MSGAHHVLHVALTGGIATGKSHCLRRLAALGVPVIDADLLAREALEPGTLGHAEVVRRFGTEILTRDGAIDRAALGRIVFADASARNDLEAIVHPLVYARIMNWFDELERTAPAPAFAVADIPLLYETGHHTGFDRVIVVACSPEQQLARVMARDGLSETAARQRIAAQWPIDQKRALADDVIDTNGTVDETRAQVDALARLLAGRRDGS
jgi:dephospho-CoA kinase